MRKSSAEILIKTQTYLLSDARALTIALFLRNFSKKNPLKIELLKKEFSGPIDLIIEKLEKIKVIERRSIRSFQYYLSSLGKEVIENLIEWSSKVHAELLEKAETRIGTSKQASLEVSTFTEGLKLYRPETSGGSIAFRLVFDSDPDLYIISTSGIKNAADVVSSGDDLLVKASEDLLAEATRIAIAKQLT